MLFNSYQFIFLFLPITLGIYWALCAFGGLQIALTMLLAASLFFYSAWSLAYLPLLVGSLIFNYLIARLIDLSVTKPIKRLWTACGVITNVGLLGYFKYTNFLLDNLNLASGINFHIDTIILPIGISFYTFQQIAYLVDCYRGAPHLRSALKYFLFVGFFPHLIAGPITHHAEVMPQFGIVRLAALRRHILIGLTIFAIGLFKKVVIADTVALEANAAFALAAAGHPPTMLDAWGGAVCYTFQIYFDFSGYTDMAIGLARMFGVRFPMNFASPYKADSMIEFWQRWHITLSRFLRDYIYVPLGGNRRGKLRRYVNVFITMLIGGVWHGAGWTYIIWGAMHGLFIALNHAWRDLFPGTFLSWHWRIAARILTMLCVLCAWVAFRSTDLKSMTLMYRGMIGLNGIEMHNLAVHSKRVAGFFITLGAAVTFLPNVAEWMRAADPVLPSKGYPQTELEKLSVTISWRQTAIEAVFVAFLFGISLLMIGNASEFIYFQF